MGKIRLVGGPFGGKVMDSPGSGNNEIFLRGPKRMTRKRRYELMTSPMYYASVAGQPGSFKDFRMMGGMVEARYRISTHPHFTKLSDLKSYNVPCMHPDGSIFYEYIEGSKVEYGI